MESNWTPLIGAQIEVVNAGRNFKSLVTREKNHGNSSYRGVRRNTVRTAEVALWSAVRFAVRRAKEAGKLPAKLGQEVR